MQPFLATVTAVVIFISTFLVSPQKFLAQNVLGENTQVTPTATTVSTDTTKAAAKAAAEAKRLEISRLRDTAKVELNAKKATLKTELTKIKDDKKRQIAQLLCDNLNSVNDKYTSHLTDVVTRLSTIVGKIESRAAIITANGGDVSSCQDALTTAKSALEQANAAVAAQVGKTYSCTITDGTNPRGSLQSIKEQLKNDLNNTKEAVKQAKSALVIANRCYGQISGTTGEPNASPAP